MGRRSGGRSANAQKRTTEVSAQFPIADLGSTVQPCGMQHGSIVAFLSGTLSPESLAAEIGPEVAHFRAALKKTAEGRIEVFHGPTFEVTREGARHLLAAVADDRLPYDTASYLADCIVMSDDFDFADEATRDAVFFIEDDTGRFATGNDKWRPSRAETLTAMALLD